MSILGLEGSIKMMNSQRVDAIGVNTTLLRVVFVSVIELIAVRQLLITINVVVY